MRQFTLKRNTASVYPKEDLLKKYLKCSKTKNKCDAWRKNSITASHSWLQVKACKHYSYRKFNTNHNDVLWSHVNVQYICVRKSWCPLWSTCKPWPLLMAWRCGDRGVKRLSSDYSSFSVFHCPPFQHWVALCCFQRLGSNSPLFTALLKTGPASSNRIKFVFCSTRIHLLFPS